MNNRNLNIGLILISILSSFFFLDKQKGGIQIRINLDNYMTNLQIQINIIMLQVHLVLNIINKRWIIKWI